MCTTALTLSTTVNYVQNQWPRNSTPTYLMKEYAHIHSPESMYKTFIEAPFIKTKQKQQTNKTLDIQQ